MKKFSVLVLAFAIALGATPAFAQTPSSQVTNYLSQLTILRQLRQGMSGDDVKTLQAILAAQPDLYPEGLVTGYYGPLTTKAVKKYQQKFGLESVGNVGPLTKKKLNELLTFNLAASVSTSSPQATTTNGTGTTTVNVGCVKIPPGHFIAPGWLKKNGGVAPVVPSCQILPFGIAKKLSGYGTSTNPGTTTNPTGTSTPVTDTTAPVISNLVASNTTVSTTQITWTTNEAATTMVLFGTVPSLSLASSSQAIVSGSSTAHTVNLSNLASSTTYYFEAISSDVTGNTATSSPLSFTTLGM